MLVASVSFSICPGCVPKVKAEVQQALRGPKTPAGFLSMYLAEIGEVNTLCCFFASDLAATTLTDIDRWLDTIHHGPAGVYIRHVERILHHSDAHRDKWRELEQVASVALVLRVFDHGPSLSETDDIVLRSLTGRHGKTWILTPVSSHDAALTLCQAGTLDSDRPLRDSVMWIPIH